MKRIAVSAAVAVVLVSGLVSAQSTPFYITDGDAHKLYVVQNGALQATYTTPSAPIFETNTFLAYPLAVGATILLGGRDNDGGVEMTTGGVLTGNTFPAAGGYTEMLDGTTDGSHNYAGVDSDEIVLRTDTHWQNAAQLFSVPFEPVGIAFDSKNGHLFLTDFSTNVYEYDLAGNQINTFDVSGTTGDVELASLAYEASTDTLWTDPNGSGTIYQFSTSGQPLATLVIPGFAPRNNWGGEMPVSSRRTTIVDTPTLSTIGFIALAGLLAVGGLAALGRVSG